MKERLSQAEWEDLSADLDGELDVDAAARVAARLAADPVWAQARRELQALDEALNLVDVPPAPEGLAERICANVRSPSRAIRLVRWLAPLAAAAVVLAVLAYRDMTQPKPPGNSEAAATPAGKMLKQADAALAGLPDEDRLAVEAMDFFKNYDVLDNFETLQAIDRLESQES